VLAAIRPSSTMGAEERRPDPAQPAIAIVQRALRPRSQRDEELGRDQEHCASARADRGGKVLHGQETSLGMLCLPCKSPLAPLYQRGE
jgi:hypothetical protein